jgi:hypothetical protein
MYPMPMIGKLIQNIHRQVTKIISKSPTEYCWLRQTILSKSSTDYWARNRTNGPHAGDEAA